MLWEWQQLDQGPGIMSKRKRKKTSNPQWDSYSDAGDIQREASHNYEVDAKRIYQSAFEEATRLLRDHKDAQTIMTQVVITPTQPCPDQLGNVSSHQKVRFEYERLKAQQQQRAIDDAVRTLKNPPSDESLNNHSDR